MNTSELIRLLLNERRAFGDQDVMVFCPCHSGEDGEPMPVHDLGWYGNSEKKIRAVFLVCVECHYEGISEKHQAAAMEEFAGEPMMLGEDCSPMTLEDFEDL